MSLGNPIDGCFFIAAFAAMVLIVYTTQIENRMMKKTLLLVVSHEKMRHLLGAFLSHHFQVSGAQTSLEAMVLLKKGLFPAVIIAESHSTFFNGDHLLECLRCSGIYQHIPVILLCDDDKPAEAERFRQMGASACLNKPFNPLILQQILLRFASPMTLETNF